VIYRRRASPLHAARAAAAIAWCAALAVAVLLESNPIVLGVLTLVILSAGPLAGVGPQLGRVLLWAIPVALTICLINALVTRDGLTVIWRLGDLPILGQTNITLEATAYGGVLALRAAALILLGGLYSLAIDPDDVLRLFRRLSFSSALSAAIATRMIPVLLRDSRRLADAQRCRPGDPPGRIQLLRATTSGVLDRAIDVAAALEVRGYGAVRQRARGWHHHAWSRHDLGFTAAAVAVLTLTVLSRALGWSPFEAYPLLKMPVGAETVAVAVALAVVALAPFADRRGIAR
jgi:energy-coupling factor transport system permease protein